MSNKIPQVQTKFEKLAIVPTFQTNFQNFSDSKLARFQT